MRMRNAFQLASTRLLTGMLPCLLLAPAVAVAASKTADQKPTQITQAQIVRLSLVDGDVRIARDQQQGQAKNTDWEKAATGLPLESGFSIATGDGRAVIELQDASTLYLSPNSVLFLNDLTTTGDIPNTEVALLTGTMTLHVHPVFPGEKFVLRAPTDTMTVSYPNRNDFRVTAYLDALALTPLTEGSVMPAKSGSQVGQVGNTMYYRAGKPVTVKEKVDGTSMSDWDQWVAAKFAERTNAYATVMKDSGMKTLLPGLDSLQGKGKFVDCGEYGKCWEPPAPPAADAQAAAAANGASGSALVSTSEQASTGDSGGSSTQPTIIRKVTTAPRSPNSGAGTMLAFDPLFPCGPNSFYYNMNIYRRTGMMPLGAYGTMGVYGGVYDPYMWAVCHTGSWIYQDNRYLWVPGTQIHNEPPVQWVKYGNNRGFVPIHPRDVAGQAPVNIRNGMFGVGGRNSFGASPIKIENTGSVRLLNSPPRGFHEGYSISLARSDSPRMVGRILGADGGPKTLLPGNTRTVGISYNHERGFEVARPVGVNSMRTTNEPVGSFLARTGVGGFGGPVAYRPAGDIGMRQQGAFNGGGRMEGGRMDGGLNGGARAGEFRGGAVFNGGAQRGGGAGEMGGNYGANMGNMRSGPMGGYGPNTGAGGYSGGNMGGGGGGAAPSGGGGFGGGSVGGGSFGGGNMGGGGGHVGATPAPSPK